MLEPHFFSRSNATTQPGSQFQLRHACQERRAHAPPVLQAHAVVEKTHAAHAVANLACRFSHALPALLCHAMLCLPVPCNAVPCHATKHNAKQCIAMQHSTTQRNANIQFSVAPQTGYEGKQLHRNQPVCSERDWRLQRRPDLASGPTICDTGAAGWSAECWLHLSAAKVMMVKG